MVITLTVSMVALLLSALFSAAEVAIFSVRAPALKALRAQDKLRAEWIAEVLAQPRRFLVTILLGNVAANAVVACGLTLFFYEMMSARGSTSWWISMAATVGLLLFFGELLPKAVASLNGPSIALRLVGPFRLIERSVRPMTAHMDRVSQRWAAQMAPESLHPIRGLTEDEYVTMLDVGLKDGALRPSERRLIERTLRLASRDLRELMTPRSEMCCLDMETELAEMKRKAASMKHRRLPLYSESQDSIVGALNVRRLMLQSEPDVLACIETVGHVPETMRALELFKNFLRGPQRMAMVVDEFGGVEGMITLEDLIEEVFGEIYDEYDDASPDWEEIEPQVFLVKGSAHLPAISQWLGVELEADGIDTLGGWITDRLGALPHVGEKCALDGYTFQVERMQRFRVGAVLVRDEKRRRR